MTADLKPCPWCVIKPMTRRTEYGVERRCETHTVWMPDEIWNRTPSARPGWRLVKEDFERLARASIPFVDVMRTSSGRIPVEKLSAAQWHELVKAYEAVALHYLTLAAAPAEGGERNG